MIIRLKDVQRDERHLLFCSNLFAPPKRRRRRSRFVGAMNRSLRIHGESIDQQTVVPVPIGWGPAGAA